MDHARDAQAERLKEAMHTVKDSMKDTVGEIGDRVSRAADWREQVRAHPTASLAVAAVAGLLVGRQLAALLGAGGLAALGASAALRAVPSRARGNFIADRVLAGVSSSLASALVGPVVTGVQSFLESSRWSGHKSRR